MGEGKAINPLSSFALSPRFALWPLWLDCGNGSLKDHNLALRGLNEQLIGIVAFQCAGDGLAASNQADSYFLVLELGNEVEGLGFGLVSCGGFGH